MGIVQVYLCHLCLTHVHMSLPSSPQLELQINTDFPIYGSERSAPPSNPILSQLSCPIHLEAAEAFAQGSCFSGQT